MATVPLSGTNIRILSGVPFQNDYKNTRWFDTKSQQETYFLNKNVVHLMTQANFQRIEGKHFISVNKSIDELWNANYVMFQNAEYNNKWFYAFVTKLEYVQKKTTYVHFQIDVFQTWKFEMNFKPSFVVREHRPLWNDDGTPVVNTLDEGLHYGTEYETVSLEKYRPFGDIYFLVIVTKTAMHTEANEITPVLNGLPQPLSYYVAPFKLDGTVPTVGLTGSSEGALVNTPIEILKAIFKMDNAVNNVVSLYVTDYIGNDMTTGDNLITFNGDCFSQAGFDDGTNFFNALYAKKLSSYNERTIAFPNKYEKYESVKESKLLMYPYTVLILDDLKGNRTVLKNEYLDGNQLNITVRGSLGTSNKVSYSPSNYLTDSDLSTTSRTLASFEKSVINNNPNDLPIMNDYLSAYLQGNRNSIENQKNSILWNGGLNAVGSAVGGIASAKNKNPFGVISSGVNMVQGAGDTLLQLQAIQAKQKDIDNTPPQLVKMGGNTNYDYGNGINGLYIIRKQITKEYRDKLTHFFNMFGYKTNEVKIPNFHTRQYWNFVQTTSCIITGDFNNEDLQELKSVFDNGITLWHTDDVGNYSLENVVI